MKLNLIEELTTYKCDFQSWPLGSVRENYDVRVRREPENKPFMLNLQIDPQSHAAYKSSIHVPFDLYLAPKSIIDVDPRECFKMKEPLKYNSSRENNYFSTVLYPALTLNQIEDEKNFKKIIKYTYTGMHKLLMKEAAPKISKQPNPPTRVVTEECDISFRSDIYPSLPYGWIAAAKHWDCLQNRSLGDPTKTFRTRRSRQVECNCCNYLPSMLSNNTKEQIRKLICENNLRLPYDVTKIGYGGYKSICARGVPLEKN